MYTAAGSPMDNLFNMFSGFNAGHEKALKQGIYNALAIFFLSLISVAGYGLYIVLRPFVKPLIWALLCGSVLFPFKCSLATTVQSWFERVKISDATLIVNLSLLPVHIFDNISERIGSLFRKYIRHIAGTLALILLALGAYRYTPNVITCLGCQVCRIFTVVSDFFIITCNIYMVCFRSTLVMFFFLCGLV